MKLFSTSRYIAITGAILALLACLWTLAWMPFDRPADTGITLEEVELALKPPAGGLTLEKALPDTSFPPAVLRTFGEGDHREVLIDWLSVLSEDDRRDFLANLEEVIVESSRTNTPTKDVINKFKELKFEKIQTKQSSKITENIKQTASILTALGSAALSVLMCMALVLLAIERNTRRKHENNPTPNSDDVLWSPSEWTDDVPLGPTTPHKSGRTR